ncbi:MAG TPA: UDP-N-acetyl-D-glucosamine dehydrogenase, partial [Chloroflexi bacterium]|nr:UDP-N-acetyl-D-glucosamine dehydrogenase [Chloroflexota bacterium]
MTQQTTLIDRFARRDAHVAVIGLGYVGLPLAVAFAEAGYRVTGIDLDTRKVDAINRGESYIEDVPAAKVAALVQQSEIEGFGDWAIAGTMRTHAPHAQPPKITGRLSATTDFSVLAACDAVSICVPTPLNKTGDPDVSYIASAAEQIARYLHPGMVIVLESTTYPGTTREMLLTQFAANAQGWRVGEDFFLAFSPERVDPGRTDWTTRNTPKVIG